MNIGLSFSGGGIKGVAHLGVLKALSEHNIKPTHISGTSAGAIVGALYAAGHDWEKIYEFFKTTPVFSIKRFARRKPGFLDSALFHKDLSAYFIEDSFESLQLPLSITATTVLTGQLRTFDSGPLINPVIASASFPGIFTPIEIDDVHYFDGGVIDDFPIEPLVPKCDVIIGSYVNPLEAITMKNLKYSYQVLNRAYEINLHHRGLNKFKDCDLLICPEKLAKFGTFSMRSIPAIFEIGYEEASKQLENSTLFK